MQSDSYHQMDEKLLRSASGIIKSSPPVSVSERIHNRIDGFVTLCEGIDKRIAQLEELTHFVSITRLHGGTEDRAVDEDGSFPLDGRLIEVRNRLIDLDQKLAELVRRLSGE